MRSGVRLTENDQNEELPETQIGTFKAGEGKWGSCVRVLDPVTQQTAHKLDLDVDEAAVCLTVPPSATGQQGVPRTEFPGIPAFRDQVSMNP